MPSFEFKEETDELVYVTCAVGGVTEPLNVELYERLYDTLTISEQFRLRDLQEKMQFRGTGEKW